MTLISRQEALSAGLVRYFTGNPCSNGHIAERFVMSRQCVECSRLIRARRVAENPSVNQSKRNPEQKAQHAAYMRKRYADNPDLIRSANLSRYGLTIEDYQSILESQGGHCAICPSRIGNKKYVNLFVDHCHQTNSVRGLLCDNCNKMLGHASDRPEVLRAAANYLEASRCLS